VEEVDIFLNRKLVLPKAMGIICWVHEKQPGFAIEDIKMELLEITRSAGFQVEEVWEVKLSHPFSYFYLGKGKVEEIQSYLYLSPDIKSVVINAEISPSQQKHLEAVWNLPVYTKIALIHRIFAARARTSEGKIKVEVAQLHYQLSRLVGKGKEMSRLGGGIGTRGPGEQKIEAERRRIKEKIAQLNKELKRINRHRLVQKSLRLKRNLPIIAIVGYTNAGKSTLLNSLANAHAYTEDRMFATLDPSARKSYLPGIGQVIFTDTVGFIREMPDTLIDAFRATLDEINDADCILEVLDISDPNYTTHYKVINQILQDVGISYRPKIIIFNKIDRVDFLPGVEKELFDEYPWAMVSAENKIGLENLLELIKKVLVDQYEHLQLLVSYGDLPTVEKEIYRHGYIENLEYLPDGKIRVCCTVHKGATGKLRQVARVNVDRV